MKCIICDTETEKLNSLCSDECMNVHMFQKLQTVPGLYAADPAAKERAKIVAWMRATIATAYELDGPGTLSPQWFADAIERGEHLK